MEKKVFRSRVSVLLVIFILTVFSLPLILLIREGNIPNSVFRTMTGVIVFIVLLFCGIRYVISGNKLYLKVFWVIPFGSANIVDIFSVKRSYNPISSPAVSLKRVQIDGHGFTALISPVREQEFLAMLKAINPNIQINVPDKNDWWRIWDWDI